ncbi:MAG: serine/threonine protein phosphatase [Lachnospiraceae bacterium]|nr:serine/threonine protein phosphatase [Lachnospiraceae bacterium]
MSYTSRIDRAFYYAPTVPLSSHDKYVLFSDCHRGNGTSGDNFLKNQNLYFAALDYYYHHSFGYIELGDGDELWENRHFSSIQEIHSNVFWLLSLFHKEKRLWMLYGNHDIVKKNLHPFPDCCFYEGLRLKDCVSGKELYLTHGHQADFLNSKLWRLSRFLVRYLWQPLEEFGVLDPTSAAKNYRVKKKTEKRLQHWAKTKNRILIAGHTHRPVLGSKDSTYFNTGSCVHPRCITCIEIINRRFILVKWTLSTKEDRTLYVAREPLDEPIALDEIF